MVCNASGFVIMFLLQRVSGKSTFPENGMEKEVSVHRQILASEKAAIRMCLPTLHR